MARSEKDPQQELHVEWELVGVEAGKERPKLAAYAFSPGGKLLDKKPLEEKGARLAVPAGAQPTGVRVMVGPDVESATADELIRRGAMEQHLRVEAKDARLIAKFTVLEPIWLCWLRSACVVRGTLVKRVISGGVSLELPVCNATVDIYEVDPLFIILPRLPLEIIDRIRQLIIDPRPPPELQAESAPRPLSGPRTDSKITTALREVTASSSSSLKLVAQTGSRQAFEKVLVANPELTRLILCHYFPLLVTMQKVATTTTNDCGHFQALFFQGCNNHDVPDLYFKAHQRLFGFFDVTIYAPTPVACHTFWNYQCGTEVKLVTTNPLAITCSPCPPVNAPENWVLWTAIGNTSLKTIFGGGASGATLDNWGLTGGAPWGGTLRPRLDFDNSLRESLGVKYYQLSWRPGTSGGWKPLSAEVFRHYAHFVGSDLVISPYRLGPNPTVVGGQTLQLYEIPPAVPPIGQWTVANAVLDTENGEFPSFIHARGLAYNEDGTVADGTVDESGLYQLKLDLYDASGNLIDIAAKGIKYVVPDSADLSGTIQTVNANTVAQPGGGTLVVGNSMVLTLHIDNNHCWADVGAPSTPSGTADECCGVVRYQPGASVTMPYVSFHPHGYATHSIYVFRSATNILFSGGGVGSFSIVRTVSDMMSLNLPPACLSGPPCTTAAFGEHLEVYAMATDGWGTDLHLNDVDDRAFALAHP